MKNAQEPRLGCSRTKNGFAFCLLYFRLSGAVTGVTGENKLFIIIFAAKSLIVTCDNCDMILLSELIP